VGQEGLGGLGDQQHLETLGDQEAQLDRVYQGHPGKKIMIDVSIKHDIISQTLLTLEYSWPQNIDKTHIRVRCMIRKFYEPV